MRDNKEKEEDIIKYNEKNSRTNESYRRSLESL